MNDRSIDLALKTWYPKDHPLHFDIHHPLGKLVGEWGELLDDYMKHLYKPGYEWKPLNELVDIWYYIRILAYQTRAELIARPITVMSNTERIIAYTINITSGEFQELCQCKEQKLPYTIDDFPKGIIQSNYSSLVCICSSVNLTINQLTEESWEKLKPGSERGDEWMKRMEFNWSEFEEE